MTNFNNSNNFVGGLSKDFSEVNQPESTYINALNMINFSERGDIISLTNERGTVVITNLADGVAGYQLIGHIVLEKDILIVLHNTSLNRNKFGWVDNAGVYTTALEDTNNELELDLDHPLSCQARVLIDNSRVLYFCDNKNFIRVINYDLSPQIPVGKISKLTELVLRADFPTISSLSLQDGSSQIKTGAYQFIFRYIDEKGNYTIATLPSQPIGIGTGIDVFSNLYQGGYSDIDSGKILTIGISNVDTDYTKLEIIALSYDVNNTLKIYVTGEVIISGSTASFDFKGTELYSITSEEALGITTNYSSCKIVTQKDGRLFGHNLEENTIEDDAALKEFATKIVLNYSVDTQTGENFYKDPYNNAFKVGYKRGEVYSFAFGVIYKNGAKSPAYHIPNLGLGNIPVYTSTIQYPSDYSGILVPAGGILHHKMPDNNESPMCTINSGTDSFDIHILNVEPTFTADLPADIKSNIQGFYIARQSREDDSNKSIYAQGIGNFMMDKQVPTIDIDQPLSTVSYLGTNFAIYPGLIQKTKSPFLGGIRLGDYLPQLQFTPPPLATWFGSTDTGDALQTVSTPNLGTWLDAPYTDNDEKRIKIDNNPKFVGSTTFDTVQSCGIYTWLNSFHSPETELLPKLPINKATKIRKIGNTSFAVSTVRLSRSSYVGESTKDNYSEMATPPVLWLKGDQSADASFVNSNNNNATYNSKVISDQYYVPRNTSIATDLGIINNENQEEFLLINTLPSSGTSDIELVDGSTIPSTQGEYTRTSYEVRNIGSPTDDDDISTPTQYKNIFELVSENLSQYGTLSSKEFVLCHYQVYDQSTTPSMSAYDGISIYGGDTYVSRFAFTNKTAIKSKHTHFVGAGTNVWEYANNASNPAFGREYLDFRAVISFVVESFKNVDLRHDIEGGNVYKFKSPDYNVCSTNPAVIEDAKSYNNQYDFENRFQLFFSPSGLSGSSNISYKTRTIWSDQTILGELRDRYRDLRINNYYDLPFNTGEIWNAFVHDNIMYLHTPKTLWRAFVNSIEQQASTAGQVILGTGGVFPVTAPPQQVMTMEGGFGGTISQWGGCLTPVGYIFPDRLQGKIFIVRENNLSDITAGLSRYFNDYLSDYELVNDNYLDNPFKYGSEGLLAAYDHETKRFILSKSDVESPFTLSFSTINKNWLSYHSYQPNYLISVDNKLFSGVNNTIVFNQHNKGNYGEFYGAVYPSTIDYVVNKSNNSRQPLLNETKVFDTVEMIMSITDEDGNYIIYPDRNNSDTIQLYNDRCNTGITNLVYTNDYGALHNVRTESLVRFKNNEYRVSLPLNALQSGSLPQKDKYGNIVNNNLDTSQTFRERIKGKFAVIKLSFSNLQNLKTTLNSIVTNFRINYR